MGPHLEEAQQRGHLGGVGGTRESGILLQSHAQETEDPNTGFSSSERWGHLHSKPHTVHFCSGTKLVWKDQECLAGGRRDGGPSALYLKDGCSVVQNARLASYLHPSNNRKGSKCSAHMQASVFA